MYSVVFLDLRLHDIHYFIYRQRQVFANFAFQSKNYSYCGHHAVRLAVHVGILWHFLSYFRRFRLRLVRFIWQSNFGFHVFPEHYRIVVHNYVG